MLQLLQLPFRVGAKSKLCRSLACAFTRFGCKAAAAGVEKLITVAGGALTPCGSNFGLDAATCAAAGQVMYKPGPIPNVTNINNLLQDPAFFKAISICSPAMTAVFQQPAFAMFAGFADQVGPCSKACNIGACGLSAICPADAQAGINAMNAAQMAGQCVNATIPCALITGLLPADNSTTIEPSTTTVILPTTVTSGGNTTDTTDTTGHGSTGSDTGSGTGSEVSTAGSNGTSTGTDTVESSHDGTSSGALHVTSGGTASSGSSHGSISGTSAVLFHVSSVGNGTVVDGGPIDTNTLIYIGAGLGVALLFGAIGAFFCRYRQNQRKASSFVTI